LTESVRYDVDDSNGSLARYSEKFLRRNLPRKI
jgi:hypothetical protein